MTDTWTGECCIDCAMLIANGETPPDLSEDATDAWLREIEYRAPGHLILGEDAGFSHSQCDTCGSTLGGDRFTVTGNC